MCRIATAFFCASLALGAVAATPVAAPAGGIDVVGPPAGAPSWSGDRMRGARERIKDILPSRHG